MLLDCSNFQKLSPNLKKRLAVENDDKASQWSIADLMPLHDRIGIPLLTQAGCLSCAALMVCSVTQIMGGKCLELHVLQSMSSCRPADLGTGAVLG